MRKEVVEDTAIIQGNDIFDPMAGIRLILKENPPLSPGEEKMLFGRIIDGSRAKELAVSGPGDQDENERRILAGELAREQIILHNCRLVASIAGKFTSYGLPFPDLFQEGNLGLMEAVRKFDPSKGNKFSSYATPAIRHAIKEWVLDNDKPLPLPEWTRLNRSIWLRAQDELRSTLRRPPTDEEIIEATGLSKKQLENLKNLPPLETVSIDSSRFGGTAPLVEQLTDVRTAGTEPQALTRVLIEQILGCPLSDKQLEIFRMHFLQGMDLRQINERLGLRRGNAEYAEQLAFRAIRESLGITVTSS